MKIYRKVLILIVIATWVVAVTKVVRASEAMSSGIVSSIQRAWVTADGDVSGQPALWKIVLEGTPDPSVPGRGLVTGHQIRVIFPPEFDLTYIDPAFPVANVPTPFPPTPPLPPQPCLPGNFQCTTGVLLQGWPEHPFFPPVLFHTVHVDTADNAFVYTAVQDILPNPPINPGIKELFVLLNGVRNPEPGEYLLRVEAQTGPGGSWETGSGIMRVLPRPRPSINATSVFVKAQAGLLNGAPACGPGTLPPNPDNPVWQHTSVDSLAPFFWSFILWGSDAEPLDDLDIRWITSDHAHLKRGRQVVGQIFIDAPKGATGYGIEVNPLGCTTYLPAAPVIGATPGIGPQPVGRLDLRFRAGSAPGIYTTILSLNNGNSEQMVVIAE